MQSMTPPRSDRRPRSMVLPAVLGTCLAAAGLGIAFLALETPLASTLVPGSRSGTPITPIVWALALVAGGALLVAGTNRLAAVAAEVRSGRRHQSPLAQVLGSLPPDMTPASDVVPTEGRPIPHVVVGPFGVAVIHELGGIAVIRQVGTAWERKTRDGWVPTEHPLDRAERDAERVRHWSNHGDLDFVVRVYAGLVTTDPSMLRSPLCAVITEDRIPDWLAALPPQRSLTEGRRQQLATRIRATVPTGATRRDW
ncbi:MAG: hypothetical protein ACJ77O_01585 [Chloroflexota bacterium]